ncbi:uncharacterized protein LOC124452237 [Xenia sp. Carnegie-2017]|uniref:uncharacterized protein LOC124452237 n=1 Tax=Xenia sp. Carnegie-2017 TaxID=2897299 RepID=UPI001F044905|nr:uncharacterized protein LOC124452237 [Xenia sp. Carnegie-2017]
MLVEIIECALWLCSLFAPDTSRMRSNSESLAENTNVEFREIENADKDNYINKEYDDDNYAQLSSDHFVPSDSSQYGSNYNACQNCEKVWRTFCKCFWMNLNIIVASIIPIAFFITLVYVLLQIPSTSLILYIAVLLYIFDSVQSSNQPTFHSLFKFSHHSSRFYRICLLYFTFIFYKFTIIPVFNKARQSLYKFLIATSSPLASLIPTVLCGHIALKRSSELVHPGRSFVLVFMIRGGTIFLYRTMQTNFKSIWLFTGLSLLSAVLNFLKRATEELRLKLWKRIVSALKKLRCFQRLQVLPWSTAHARRLKADLEIQDILFEYNTLVLSQAYFISYQLQSFNIATEPLLLEFLKRIAIGVLIDFIFNWLSNFVQMYYHNIPIGRVWKKYWKRHLFANVVVVLVIIAYFSRSLESVFRLHFKETGESSVKYAVRNCSLF